MKKTLISFIVYSVISFMAYAQVSIKGKVYDENHLPLAGANVYLSGTVIGTITDLSGSFVLKSIPTGEYELKVTYVGFQDYTKILDLSGRVNLEIQLTPKTILADEVFVTGTRASNELPITYSMLPKQKIEEQNLGQDMPFLLNILPSVVVTSDAGNGVGYTSFRVRGTDLTRINVTVNGIPINDSESHGVWWVDLPDLASSVENIQLQRGVGTSTNGAGAFGATVNLQTFTLKREPYARLSSSAGSFNTFRNSISFGTGLLSDKFAFDGRYSIITSDGYIERAASNLNSFAFSGAYYGSKKNIVRFVVLSGKERTYQSWDGVPGEMLEINRRYNGMGSYTDENGIERYYNNETDNYWQDHFQLFYSREFSSSVRLNLAFHYTHGKGYYEQYKEDQALADYLLNDVIFTQDTIRETDLIRQKWLDNDFYGSVFNLNIKKGVVKLDIGGGLNRYAGDHFGKVIWARYFSNGEKGHEWYNNTGEKNDGNIYARASVKFGPSLISYFDIQYRGIGYTMNGPDDDLRDLTQSHIYHFLNPKFGLRYFFRGGTAIYGSVAVAHREPSRYNFKDAPLNGPVPQPEMLTDFEGGMETRLGPFDLSANVYYMDYKDQLVLTGKINDVGAPIMTNVPESYRMGIELISGLQLTQQFSWQMNATLSRNKILNFTQFIDDWDTWSQRQLFLGTTDISFSPGMILKSTFEYKFSKGIRINWNSYYVGKQYIDNSSDPGRALDPYWVSNLAAIAEVTHGTGSMIRIQCRINNLFNKLYESNAWVYPYYEANELKQMTGYYPQAGRNFMVGLDVQF